MKQTIEMKIVFTLLLCFTPLGTWNVRTLHRGYSLDVLTQEFQRYNLDILGLQETRWTGKVKLEDGSESSGDAETSMLDSPSDVTSSGEGAAEGTKMPGETIDLVPDPDSDILPNTTTHPFVINNGELETTSDSANGENPDEFAGMDVTSTTTESLDQTTTEKITTTTTTTTPPPTTTTTEAVTEPVTTTTTETTTTETTPTTTMKPTTTRRPVKVTSKKPKITTMLSITEFPVEEDKVCGFLEIDFTCEEELKCFGEGVIDCTEEVDEKEPVESGSVVAATTTEGSEYDDDYIDSTDASSHLAGRAPPTTKDSSSWRTRTTITTTSTSTSTEEPTVSSSVATTSTTTTPATTETSTTTTESTTLEITTTEPTTPTTSTESSSVSSSESNAGNNSTVDSSTEVVEATRMASEDATSELKETDLVAEESGSEVASEARRRKRRRKRQSKAFSFSHSASLASESLSLTESGEEKELTVDKKKRCRVTGNLKCLPMPTIGMCKGRGTCQAPMEKAEKSSEEGVETWAIAVIAICAAAAVLTVALLIYLVITSWKKLKVQPQNGVTTLTYVNNSSPP